MKEKTNTIDALHFQKYSYEQFARLGKAFSSPVRLMLLNILSNGWHSVEELAEELGEKVSNISRHLSVLKSVNLVEDHREGKYVFYGVTDSATKNYLHALKIFAKEHLAEVQVSLEKMERSPTRDFRPTREEFVKLIKEGKAIVLDVRPASEYQAAHWPGAVMVPMKKLEQEMEFLPKGKIIICYCRGAWCAKADIAVAILRNNGFDAKRIDDGVVEWELDAVPLEHGKKFVE